MAPRRPVFLVALALAVAACGGGGGGKVVLDDLPGLERFGVQDRGHTEEPVAYPESPPVGGDHFPVWLNCGLYDGEVPEELAVHSLEHGAVWFAVDPDVFEDLRDDLVDLVGTDTHLLASPYPGLDDPIVLVAWANRIAVDDLGDPRVEAFIDAFAGAGPEPGAACSGGLGEPAVPAG